MKELTLYDGRHNGKTLASLVKLSWQYINGEDVKLYVTSESTLTYIKRLAKQYKLVIPEPILLTKNEGNTNNVDNSFIRGHRNKVYHWKDITESERMRIDMIVAKYLRKMRL